MRLLLLTLMLGTVPLPYGTPRYSLLSPVRAVSYDGQVEQMLFAGLGTTRNRHVMRPPRDIRSADRFRHDETVVWSQSTTSGWRILPPALLGTATRAGTADAGCAACISVRTIMMTGAPEIAPPEVVRLRTLPPGVAPVASAWE